MNKDLACDNLIQQITKAWPLDRWDEFGVVVAVSGGADSVALLKALAEIKKQSTSISGEAGRLVVAHFNHQMRGRESDMDAEFVEQLTRDLGLDFYSDKATQSDTSKSENELREQRYEFLCQIARKKNCRYIATAHHRDDQVETILFRFFRGTGIKGLCGIPKNRVVDESISIVRPMLEIDKALIEQSLESWGQTWRVDSTNDQSSYTRNFIRNNVLPSLRERFPGVDTSVIRLSKQAKEQAEFLACEARSLMRAVEQLRDRVSVDCELLRESHAVLLRELFAEIFRQRGWPVSQMGFEELDRLAQIVKSETDVPLFQLPGGINCEKQRCELVLDRPGPAR